MHPTDDDMAKAAASNLANKLKAEFPELQIEVTPHDFGDKLKLEVRDPATGGTLFLEGQLLLYGMAEDGRAALARARIKAWLKEEH